jgi:hypothetical protein
MFGSSAAAKTFTSLILHFKVINSSGCHNGNQEFKCLGNDGVASSRLGGAATAQHHFLRGPYLRQRPLHENHPVFVTLGERKLKARDHFHGLPVAWGSLRASSTITLIRPNPAPRAPRRTRISPLATGEITTSSPQAAAQLPHHKVKTKKAGQRACNEKNEKGKFCGGHLKRWFYSEDVIEQACGDAEKAWGPDAEVYRCEHCQTLYLPNPEEAKVNVAGQGLISVFGLTLPPKVK